MKIGVDRRSLGILGHVVGHLGRARRRVERTGVPVRPLTRACRGRSSPEALSQEPLNGWGGGRLPRKRTRIAVVIWSGELGGAETWSAAIAQQMRRSGVDATVVSITDSAPLADRMAAMAVPWVDVGFARGSEIIRRARHYARVVADAGGDGALLMASGYMASALRAGGYRSPVVGVEHGRLIETLARPRPRRWLDQIDLALGARLVDAQVAVSAFMLAQLRLAPHRADATVIPNGVDLDAFRPTRPVLDASRPAVIGWAGRMVSGKGVDDLLHATAALARRGAVELRLAGDGPDRGRIEDLAQALGVAPIVRFLGRVQDMPEFWNECDIAVASSSTLVESFGMAALEAAACGRPVVATRNGGFVDIVVDETTGRIVDRGDAPALASAIGQYIEHPDQAQAHGARARERAVDRFGIRACSDAYIALLQTLRHT